MGELYPVFRPSPVAPMVSIPRLKDVHSSGFFSNFGPQVLELEKRLAEFFDVSSDCVVLASSLTSALHGAISVSASVEWEVPAWTFPATPLAVFASGKSLVLRDVQPTSWRLRVCAEKPKSVGQLLVLPFGTGLDGFPWGNELEVIVDAAASLGELENALQGIPTSTVVTISLHATKVLGVGEGGIAVFGDPSRAQEFRRWTNFGFNGARSSEVVGYNAKMSEYLAAFIHTELDNWSIVRAEWEESRQIATSLAEKFGLESPETLQGRISPYWNVLLPDSKLRDRFRTVLSARGLDTRLWWGLGCHRNPAFRGEPEDSFPNTDLVSSRVVGLPFFRGMSQKILERALVAVDQIA